MTSRSRLLVAGLVLVVVVLQICYPLADAMQRRVLTVLIVMALTTVSVVHAALSRGVAVACALLLVTAVPGYAVEVVGVHAGVPFGSYTYSSLLGPQLLAVPVLVAVAWTMLAWPAALAATALARTLAGRVVVGAWALASADLFLDPQMVRAGAWTWREPGLALPGVPTVPVTNYLGWVAVSVVMSLAVQLVLRAGRTVAPVDDVGPLALYGWLYVGWIIALAGFLNLEAAAAWGALGMGLVALPLGWRSLRIGRLSRATSDSARQRCALRPARSA